MGFELKVSGGPGTIELGFETITSVRYFTDTPDDSNARSNDVSLAVEIKGKIITALDGDKDDTVNLAKWSVIPVEDPNCYGQVTVRYISAGMVVREMKLPNAFIVYYKESFDNETGVGYFETLIRQKKDKNKVFECSGSFGA
ncbi:membrane-associated protease 1 [Anaeromicropila populeti]|uniref:Membrane-associated protease 1 n=1 Tax=Anaeromicropila populeti TaxID=37658 RepID=A0A1I6L1Y0_9FIRM|nr:membrane-associated protease 1 [Anaeromicropila populeti]SFR97513.1 hypothetical protein SAMN05661086_03007 [Anaeromicropila populeti]